MAFEPNESGPFGRSRLPLLAILVVMAAISAFQATRAKEPLAATTVVSTPVDSTDESLSGTLSGTLRVFAASSLSAPFTEIAAEFEKANPGLTVTLNFAGSPTLATQIQNGAPADVFASADTANMDKLMSSELTIGTPSVFARNTLTIVVPKGNPKAIRSLADLAKPGVVVALGGPGVPAGEYARQILSDADIAVEPKTLESNVAGIVNKAALREIDAGIVYVTDITNDPTRVESVPIAAGSNLVASYPIAGLTGGSNDEAASAFVQFVNSVVAQTILADFKFLPSKAE